MDHRSLLITGGAGFIGANFARYWQARHPEDRITVIDLLTYAGNRANLADLDETPGFRFIKGDITDQPLIESLLRDEAVDTLVNFAAESHVDRSILGPDAFIKTNIVGTYSLLQAAKTVWLNSGTRRHRFHHVSTDEVFGSLTAEAAAFNETTRYDPSSPYSASKAASDHLVNAYHRTYGLDTTISNCSNNYGPYQFPEKLVSLCIVNLLDGKSVDVYGDGMNIRDWLYVCDHCRGIELVIERGVAGETYVIGGGAEMSNIAIIKQIYAAIGSAFARDKTLVERFPRCSAGSAGGVEAQIRFVDDRPGHDRRYAIDAEKIGNLLGYSPEHSFASGMQKTVQWYLDNEPWWRGVMDGSYRDWMSEQYSD